MLEGLYRGLYRGLFAEGIARGTEVVAEIHAHWPHRRFVANTGANRLRVVAEVARHCAIVRCTRRDGRLVESHQSTQHLIRGGEYVAHVVKEDEAQVVGGVGQQDRKSTRLNS